MSKKTFPLALCAMLFSLSFFGTILFALSFPAGAQAGKVYRLGWLGIGGPGSQRKNKLKPSPQFVAFQQRLRELGYVEGQNLVLQYRWAEGKQERLPNLAAEFVRHKVDVIVTSSARSAIRAAQHSTRTIPIVMAGSGADPVKAGIVVSLARPGGNITGMTNLSAKLHPKRLELLKEAFPRISRVAILVHRHRTQPEPWVKETDAVGQSLGIQIQLLDVGRRLDELESAFSAIRREGPDGLLVATAGIMIRHRARFIEFTTKKRLPTIYTRSRNVKAGGLMSYGTNRPDLYRRVATYVDKILKGAKPADLPVEQPTKFELVINLKTAKKLGLTFSPQFLARADKIIR